MRPAMSGARTGPIRLVCLLRPESGHQLSMEAIVGAISFSRYSASRGITAAMEAWGCPVLKGKRGLSRGASGLVRVLGLTLAGRGFEAFPAKEARIG